MTNYRKAFTFTQHVWNPNTMEKKDSENTLDDLLLYVRKKNYEEENKKKYKGDGNVAELEGEEYAEVFEYLKERKDEESEESKIIDDRSYL